MRVEVKVDWGEEPRKRSVDADSDHLTPPRSRSDRRLWYIAVAREIEAGIESGRFASYADAARRCGVSRSRISQLIPQPKVAS